MTATSLQIGPYQLHSIQGLSIRDREVRVTPKSLAVLTVLARRPGRIVTKQELFETVWAGRVVTEAALSSCIRELRRALEDDARNPRFIETVHRRGFRLLQNDADHPAGELSDIVLSEKRVLARALPGTSGIVDRLDELLARVQESGKEFGLLSGPSGIGKRALLGHFAARVSKREGWMVCEALCNEPTEAYRPLLEMLRNLRDGEVGATVSSIIESRAGGWVTEIPGSRVATGQSLPDRGSGATTKARNRELREALAAISREVPLLMCFDGLQLCDEETLRFLVSFARDPGHARILLLGSLETEDFGLQGEISKPIHDLRETACCTEFSLMALDQASVLAYMRTRSSDKSADRNEQLSKQIFQLTRGWPLLVYEVTKDWLDGKADPFNLQLELRDFDAKGEIGADSCFGDLMKRQLSRLGDTERLVLEVASVLGQQFSVHEVAAATGLDDQEVKDAFRRILTDSCLISTQGASTPSADSGTSDLTFVSDRYRNVLRERVDMLRSVDLHRRVGRWLREYQLQDGYPAAPRLARHLEQAGQLDESARYWYEAGALARRRGSHGIALKNFRRAQVSLQSFPWSPDRDVQAAKICSALGREIVSQNGLDAPEANRLYLRALNLSQKIPDGVELSQVLWRLWVFYLNRGPLETAGDLADRLLGLAQNLGDPAKMVQAYHAKWAIYFMRGDLRAVREHTQACITVCASGMNGSATLTTGCTLHDAHLTDHNVAICAGLFSSWADAVSGRQDSAIHSLDAVIAHGRDLRHPFTLTLALAMSAGTLVAIGNAGLARQRAAECRSIASKHGFNGLYAWSAIYEGWALVELGDTGEGMALLNEGMSATVDFGMRLLQTFNLGIAAAALLRCGRLKEASRSLAEAITSSKRSGHHFGLPEIYRLRGELGLETATDRVSRAAAVEDLRAAAEMAGAAGAHLWEDRAKKALKATRHS